MEPEKKHDSVEDFYAVRLKLGAISQEEYNKLMEQTKVEKDLEEKEEKQEIRDPVFAASFKKTSDWLKSLSSEEFEDLANKVAKENMD